MVGFLRFCRQQLTWRLPPKPKTSLNSKKINDVTAVILDDLQDLKQVSERLVALNEIHSTEEPMTGTGSDLVVSLDVKVHPGLIRDLRNNELELPIFHATHHFQAANASDCDISRGNGSDPESEQDDKTESTDQEWQKVQMETEEASKPMENSIDPGLVQKEKTLTMNQESIKNNPGVVQENEAKTLESSVDPRIANDNSELESSVSDSKSVVSDIEEERDFYFGKLRSIEILLQTERNGKWRIKKDVLIERLFKVLYATDDNDIFVDYDGEIMPE